VHAGKLGQVTNFWSTIVGGTAKHCIDQYMVLFRYCSLGDNTAMLGRLHASLCHAFLSPLGKSYRKGYIFSFFFVLKYVKIGVDHCFSCRQIILHT